MSNFRFRDIPVENITHVFTAKETFFYFPIVDFPFLNNEIPLTPFYGVYLSSFWGYYSVFNNTMDLRKITKWQWFTKAAFTCLMFYKPLLFFHLFVWTFTSKKDNKSLTWGSYLRPFSRESVLLCNFTRQAKAPYVEVASQNGETISYFLSQGAVC